GGHTGAITALALSADGSQLATAARDTIFVGVTRDVIILWAAESGQVLQQVSQHLDLIQALAFSPDGEQFLSGADDTRVILWDATATGNERRFSGGHQDGVLSLAFSPDGQHALSGGRDNLVMFWEVASGSAVQQLHGHRAPVRALAFSPNGQLILTAGGRVQSTLEQDNRLLLWQVGEPIETIQSFNRHNALVNDLAFAPDGNSAYSAGEDGVVIRWQIQTIDGLLDWIYANYDAFCYTGEGFGPDARCASQEPSEEEGVEARDDQTMPLQTVAEAPATAVCSVQDPRPLSTELVEPSNLASTAPYRIGFSNSSTTLNPLDAFVGAWANYEATRHPEIEEFIYLDAPDDPEQQAADLLSLVEAGVDLILLNPSERADDTSAFEAALQAAADANIPVIFVNKRLAVDETFYLAFLGPDDYTIGCLLAQELVAALDGEGITLRVSGINQAPSREERRRGALAIFNQYPEIGPIGDLPTDLALNGVQANVNTIGGQTVNGIWADNGALAYEALLLLQQNGQPLPPAFGDQHIGLAGLMRDNNLPGMQVRVPATLGAEAVQLALQVLQGASIPRFIPVELSLLDPASLSDEALDYPPNGLVGDYEGLPPEFHPDF
ncbi:MAG: substrate-binding domain-containing protein, partial [Anaerolineae bacterium]|nr:substrate-binding domain-containing protein [Anaerolineae bacterium]